MTDYIRCSLFGQSFNIQVEFEQKELKLQEGYIVEGKVLQSPSYRFDQLINKWSATIENFDKIDPKKPLAIITIKNNLKLLQFTVNKLITHKCLDSFNLLIVDDRSTEDLKTWCLKKKLIYARVENSLNEFNFSVLNNIGAWIADCAKCDTIILWNSDLWPESDNVISEILKLHKENGSTISGTKLLYPKVSWDGDQSVPDNILNHFPHKALKFRGSIQFGGGIFFPDHTVNAMFPNHICRFMDKETPISNTDKTDFFVTGAFQVINLKWFIENGGLHCSLANQFQDVDLCLRAVEQQKKVMYFGKDRELYHDESLVHYKEGTKMTKQFFTDHVLYIKTYPMQRFFKLLGD